MDSSSRPSILTRVSALLSLVLLVLAIAVNALAEILPINGLGTGRLSDEIPNLFVPAGITFSIWGLIYVLLFANVAAAMAGAFGGKPFAFWRAADGLIFSLNMAANSLWILAWHYRRVGLSLAIMFLILGSLVWLEERQRAASSHLAQGPGALPRLLLSTPINVYLGWICVATIANATALLVKLGWEGFGIDPRVWTVAVILLGLAIGLLLTFLRGALAAPLVIAWAYAGIVLKRIQTDALYSRAVWLAAGGAAIVLLLASLLRRSSARGRAGRAGH